MCLCIRLVDMLRIVLAINCFTIQARTLLCHHPADTKRSNRTSHLWCRTGPHRTSQDFQAASRKTSWTSTSVWLRNCFLSWSLSISNRLAVCSRQIRSFFPHYDVMVWIFSLAVHLTCIYICHGFVHLRFTSFMMTTALSDVLLISL